MNNTLRLITALSLISLLLRFGCSTKPSMTADEILQATAKAYKQLQSYQDKSTVIMNVSAQGMKQKMETTFSLSLKRPNKLALLLESGMTGATLVSNGTQLWTYLPMINKYTVEEAPENLQGVLEASGSGTVRSLMMLSLFEDDPYETLMEDVEKVELAGEETLDGTNTYHLILREEDFDLNLWIETEDFMIRKLSFDLSQMMEDEEEVGEEMQQMFSKMQMSFEELHHSIKLNPEIPDNTFAFTPPTGAAETEDFLAELMPEKKPSPLEGKQAPEFTLPGLTQDTSFQLTEYQGKVVMLDFWATWCPPCRKELPILQSIYDQYKDKEFFFIAINSGEARKTVEKFIAKEGFSFPVALDEKDKVGKLYGIEAIPTLFLIDQQGQIQKVHEGLTPGLEQTLKKEIDALLQGEPLREPEPEATPELSGLEQKWTTQDPVGGLATGDMTGDQKNNLVTVSTDANLCVYDTAGNRLTTIKCPKEMSRIRLSDLDGDGQLEIVGFRPWGPSVIALNANGEKLWEFTEGQGVDDVATVDVDGDNTQEVIIGYNGFTGLHLLDSTGKVRWKYTGIGNVWHVTGGDLQANGSIEVVSTSAKGIIHVFDPTGKELTKYGPGCYMNFVYLGEFIADSQGPELITTGSSESGERLTILNGTGHVLWEVFLGGSPDASVEQVACLPQKGWLAVGTMDGQLFVLNSQGDVIAKASGLGPATLVSWFKDDAGTYLLAAGSVKKGLAAYEVVPAEKK